MREISIRHGARMANRMLQLLTAHHLADRAGGAACRITGYNIPEWDLAGEGSGRGYRRWPKLDGTAIDIPWLLAQIDDGALETLRITESICNARLLPDRGRANGVFDAGDETFFATGPGDLVIHVRLEDILQPGRHQGYGPLPLSWYDQLLSETGLRPVFVGQFGDDPYSDALKTRFPDAVVLEGGSVLHDFQTIRNAHNVAVGISTFSWLAAWLGARSQIFMPLMGITHPLQYPRIDLTPQNDPRFRFDLFAPRTWMADADALDTVINGTEAPARLTAAALATLRARADALAAPEAAEWRVRMETALSEA